jgi:phosphoserine phosphatase RsbU/P
VATPDQNIALTRLEDGSLRPLSPDMAAARLNKMILSEIRSDRYFTLCLGFLNLATGRMRMVQAGHPHPLVLRADGRVETVGEGGLPIGLVREATYSSFEIGFGPGDRMLIYSDGLIECSDPDGATLEEAGLARLVAEHADLRGPAFLSALEQGLARFAGTDALGDDASAVVIDYVGPDGSG